MKTLKICSFLLLFFISCKKEDESRSSIINNSTTSSPLLQWQRCYGGSNIDYAYSVNQTADGGYIFVGGTSSTDGDVNGNLGQNMLVIKTNNLGGIEWQKCYGGYFNGSIATDVLTTPSGEYIIAGATSSPSGDGDVTLNHGVVDIWIVKINQTGQIVFNKSFGGSDSEYLEEIQGTADGGFILVGSTVSNNGDVVGNHGESDIFVLKLDSNFNIDWRKCYGGSLSDDGLSIQQTNDGGFILAGHTFSNDGDVTGNHGNGDYWLAKLSSSGTIQWQHSMGGTDEEYGEEGATSVRQTADGGYIFVGSTSSNDGDVSGNHLPGHFDNWIVKINSIGTIEWQKCIGGFLGYNDFATSVRQTADGGYVFVGATEANDGDVTGNHGGYDMWVVKTNNNGAILWQKCLGGSLNDVGVSVQQTTDGGYVVAGNTESGDGDVVGNHGGGDVWVVKLQ